MPRRPPRKGRQYSRVDLSLPPEALQFTVPPERAGERLDRYLVTKLKWRSRESVQALIAGGRVTVSGARRKKSYAVREGDLVRVAVPPLDEPVDLADIPLEVIYEDEHLVAVNKRPDIVVHPTGPYRFGTLINALHHRYRDDPDCFPKLCHRLDRETSGVVVAAKRDRARSLMQGIFERRRCEKEYLAVVEGAWGLEDEGVIDAPIGRDGGAVKSKMAVRPGGLPSRSRFRVVERFAAHALLSLEPLTGRTHQLRVHCAYAGHPIVGDPLYGGPSGPTPFPRQALHAWRYRFTHPMTRVPLEIVAPVPDDLRDLLARLRAAPSGL